MNNMDEQIKALKIKSYDLIEEKARKLSEIEKINQQIAENSQQIAKLKGEKSA